MNPEDVANTWVEAEILLANAEQALADPGLSSHLRRQWQATLLEAKWVLKSKPQAPFQGGVQ